MLLNIIVGALKSSIDSKAVKITSNQEVNFNNNYKSYNLSSSKIHFFIMQFIPITKLLTKKTNFKITNYKSLC